MPAADGSPGAGRPAAGASAAFGGTSADVATAGTAAGGDAARIPGEVFRDCADCPEMVVVPAGAFRMGCGSGQVCGNDELPVHEVRVEAFALGRYEVLFEEIVRMSGPGVLQPFHGRVVERVVNLGRNDDVLSERRGCRNGLLVLKEAFDVQLDRLVHPSFGFFSGFASCDTARQVR